MPWQRRAGSDGCGGEDEGAFSQAQLASLRDLEADVSRSIRIVEHVAATAPSRYDNGYFIQLAEDLMTALALDRLNRAEDDCRSRQDDAVAVERRRARDAGHCVDALADLLRDVERQLTTLRVHADRLVDAVDRAAFMQ